MIAKINPIILLNVEMTISHYTEEASAEDFFRFASGGEEWIPGDPSDSPGIPV
jgi:hypothetical protein